MHVLDACISITWGSGRGLGPGILDFFFGPVKWVRADRRVPYVKIFAWPEQQHLYFYRPLSSETGGNLILVCSLSTSLEKTEFHGFFGACRLSMETSDGGTAVAELFDGSRCGTAVAELFDSSRCGTTVAEPPLRNYSTLYTKIVLQFLKNLKSNRLAQWGWGQVVVSAHVLAGEELGGGSV